ncbi:MAG: hypothetical protein LBI64_05995 [Coriobacteriales bacterium]|jgi:trigger factor|nr:hypothetical protein [Coriobacteriales bacterium]
MKTTAQAPKNGKVKLQITATPEEVSRAFQRATLALAQQNKLTPKPSLEETIAELEEKVGKAQYGAFLDYFVPNFLVPFAISQENINATLAPQVTVESPVIAGRELCLSATITLMPIYELSSYDPVRVVLPRASASEEEIDAQFLQLAQSNATFEKTNGHLVQREDHIAIALAAVDAQGDLLPRLTADNRFYTVGEGFMPAGFDEQLLGMSLGESKTFGLAVPDLSAEDSETPTDATITVTVREINRRVIPAITDVWIAKNFPGIKTVPELREFIRSELLRAKTHELESMKTSAAAAELAKRFEGSIADEFYEFTRAEIMARFQQQLQQQGLTMQRYLQQQGIDERQFDMNTMLQIREVLVQGFSLDALARHLKLELDDEDIAETYRRMAPGYEREARAEFEGSGRLYLVRQAALRTKANTWLAQTAEVEYVEQ